MNDMEPFERRLKRQPLRQTPAAWREEILSAAMEAQPLRHSSAIDGDSLLSLINRRITSLLWPHPVAWGGLAAIWIFIFAVNYSLRDHTLMVAEKVTPPSAEVVAELRQQQRMLAELMGANESGDADRPKVFVPRPRSERVEVLTA
jgi:hypothetical protein